MLLAASAHIDPRRKRLVELLRVPGSTAEVYSSVW